MEWQFTLAILIGLLLLLLLSSLPVAFAFAVLNIVGLYLWVGGTEGWSLAIISPLQSVMAFTMLPIALFLLMGDILLNSGVVSLFVDAMEHWLGRIPGRLNILAVAGGTLMGILSGSSAASTATLGRSLIPDMRRRGYDIVASLGAILGGGGLAIIIPPSIVSIVLGALAKVSVAKVLIGGLVPGLLLSGAYVLYIMASSLINPRLAPPYVPASITLTQRLLTFRHILPIAALVFACLGIIFFGVATPTEASAIGALGSVVVAALYRRLNWGVLWESAKSTVQVTAMIMLIIAGSDAFSRILAATGATQGLVELSASLLLAPILIIISMQIGVLILGMFIDQFSIMMIMVPVCVPVTVALGFDPVWFCIISLVNLGIANYTPPFGMSLFVLKGVSPPDVTMMDVYRCGLPYVLVSLAVLGLLIALPGVALWLPNIMR